jgi:hypothetical protein
MLKELLAWHPPRAGQFRSAPGPSAWVSNRLFLGGLLPSRTRFASPVTDYSSFNRSLIRSSVCL